MHLQVSRKNSAELTNQCVDSALAVLPERLPGQRRQRVAVQPAVRRAHVLTTQTTPAIIKLITISNNIIIVIVRLRGPGACGSGWFEVVGMMRCMTLFQPLVPQCVALTY
jgi:hypothetical protein